LPVPEKWDRKSAANPVPVALRSDSHISTPSSSVANETSVPVCPAAVHAALSA
jgi:hypothetical protein